MAARLNILFVVGSLDLGGAETQMTLLIQRLSQNGHICNVFCLQHNGILEKNLSHAGVRIISCGFKKGDLRRSPWRLIPAQFKLVKSVYEIKPRIIHAYLPLTSFMAALAGRVAKGCIVITSRRALGNHQDRFPAFKPFDLAANLMSHSITVNSIAVRDDLLKRERIGSRKITLIYNGIDPERFNLDPQLRFSLRKQLKVSRKARVIIFIANLIPYKGHRDLLYAAARVCKECTNVVFWLVGEDRGIQSDLEVLADRLDISNRVFFLGRRLDVPMLLSASDIAVVTSHEEGFSNVILEAMAAGLPVVATRVGGNPEAVLDGKTGYLCNPRDRISLAEKMIDLIQDPLKAASFGMAGRRRVTALFSLDKMVDNHLTLYRNLVSRRSATA